MFHPVDAGFGPAFRPWRLGLREGFDPLLDEHFGGVTGFFCFLFRLAGLGRLGGEALASARLVAGAGLHPVFGHLDVDGPARDSQLLARFLLVLQHRQYLLQALGLSDLGWRRLGIELGDDEVQQFVELLFAFGKCVGRPGLLADGVFDDFAGQGGGKALDSSGRICWRIVQVNSVGLGLDLVRKRADGNRRRVQLLGQRGRIKHQAMLIDLGGLGVIAGLERLNFFDPAGFSG